MSESLMIVIGTAGEHLVCADLIAHGHRAFLTSAGLPYDVIADIGGRLLRVAVRSTIEARPRPGRALTRPCYQFNVYRRGKARYTKDDADLVAFVALDRKLVCYLPCSKCPTILHLDPPGEAVYPNRKGPKPGRCKRFEDFSLSTAMEDI